MFGFNFKDVKPTIVITDTEIERYAKADTMFHPRPGEYEADGWVQVYINAMKARINELEHEKARLERELKTIKPVLEHPDYRPANSSACRECKFAAFSRWSGDLIGCRKDMLCGDFQPVEKEK